MALNIRLARAEDYDSLLVVLRQVNEMHLMERPEIFKATDTPLKREDFDDILSSHKKLLFVAEDNTGKVVAYSICVIKNYENHSLFKPFKALHIDNFGVHEGCRSKGVGKRLIEHIKKYSKDNGYYRIDLDVWTCNADAIEFYKACKMKERSITMEYVLEENS